MSKGSSTTTKKAAKAPAKKAASSSGQGSASQPSAKDLDKAQKPGEQPGAILPEPHTVEGLSSAKAEVMQGAGGDPDSVRANIEKAQAEGAGFSGPNHDLADPTPEHTARPPASTVNTTGSGPLEPPEDAQYQRYPAEGYDLSSTDHTYAATGGRTVAGESFLGLVDEDGKEVSGDSLFSDEPGKTFVTVSKRVFEQFRYPNTVEVAKRLLFVPGQRVNRAEAERIKATLG